MTTWLEMTALKNYNALAQCLHASVSQLAEEFFTVAFGTC
jgi:hypothetical protein